MEDNSAVVTMANNNSDYTKKCKHFSILNYMTEQDLSDGAKRRKEHLDRYVTPRPASDSTTDADVNVPAVQSSCR